MLGLKGALGLIPRIVGDLIIELNSEETSLGWSWNAVCSAVEVFKEEAFDLLDTNRSMLRSQLAKFNSNVFDISIETIESEMKEINCANIEELKAKISEAFTIFNALKPSDDLGNLILSNRPYAKAREELRKLRDIKERYEREKEAKALGYLIPTKSIRNVAEIQNLLVS